MSALIDTYNEMLRRTSAITDRIRKTDTAIEKLKANGESNISARVERLTQQLEKIDEYTLKIEAFKKLAEKNLESRNVLTVEAPPGYRVNLNRLRQWAMMIDPTSSNDPYAQRVYVVALCDLLFLEKKKREFTERIEQLRLEEATGKSEEIRRLEEERVSLQKELDGAAMSGGLREFAQGVRVANEKYWFSTAPKQYANPASTDEYISPGAYAVPLELSENGCDTAQDLFGRFFDRESRRVLLPLEIGTDSEFAIDVECVPARARKLDRALQNLILSITESCPAGTRTVQVLDGVRYNSFSLGSLKGLENTFALAQIPRNPERMSAALEEIVSTFADIDEQMELTDSVAEYNRSLPAGQEPIVRRVLILFGWPNAFEGQDKEHVQRIMTNYERYGISFVNVSYRGNWNREDIPSTLPEYAAQNAIRIRMSPKDTFVEVGTAPKTRFTWYTMSDDLPDSYVQSLKENRVERKSLGNEYIRRYSLTDLPAYSRAYKKIELPFGIDSKERVGSLSFENENFATYLVGASRSGKSTLLHTLIAGLIRNYHPDNLELWLADFKQLEFKRYISHLPPHIKYVLLDESMELVYDLINKLTGEMMERQKLFARLGVQRIDQVDPMKLEKPLPVIFVILDEFSIMSQAIAESQNYKLGLQNLLAKGAALGIKFLFSSQTFTTGVAGLTPTARAQIQQRIAMKGSKEEISETLELSANLKTEQVRNWMDALPPHYALVKFREGPDTLPLVKRYLVMYFKDYAVRDDMIDTISRRMRPSGEYRKSDINSYVDKHPVLVDGNSYDFFDSAAILRYTGDLFSQEHMVGGVPVVFGTPRLMTRLKTAELTDETRENLLLVARSAEQPCAASVLLSTALSFSLQGGNVRVWAYSKNSLYRTYRNRLSKAGFRLVEDMDAICDDIRALRRSLEAREHMRTLIVCIGLDRICTDFDYIEGPGKGSDGVAEKVEAITQNKAAQVSTDEQELLRQKAQQWIQRKRKLTSQFKIEGKAPEEIAALLDQEKLAFFQDSATPFPAPAVAPARPPVADAQPAQPNSGAYNASGDLSYVVKQGSRMGCHFMLQLNQLADLKSTGLKMDFFRYRLAFQISDEDSREIFSSKIASGLPEHICQFDDSLERYSFRPYLHPGIGWDGWSVDENGIVTNPYENITE